MRPNIFGFPDPVLRGCKLDCGFFKRKSIRLLRMFTMDSIAFLRHAAFYGSHTLLRLHYLGKRGSWDGWLAEAFHHPESTRLCFRGARDLLHHICFLPVLAL